MHDPAAAQMLIEVARSAALRTFLRVPMCEVVSLHLIGVVDAGSPV